MLENLKAKNSDINVFSAFSEEYKEFGRIITVSDNILNEIIDTAEKISVPDSVILGHRWDILNGIIDSSKFKAFYLPKGTVTEVYATALHYTPCQVTDDGFGCIVALPEGTNTPLDTESKDKLLTAKNKWLLAHTENKAKIKQGAVAGITGENIFIHY